MRVPQVTERVKEAPASALRAMFAGIGSLLSVTDKIRAKPATETTAETVAAAPETAAPEASAAPESTAATETTADPEATVVAETTTAAQEPAPVAAAAKTTDAPESEEAAALPLPNYDELSIASLRARLRNLSPDQLTVLISYEKSHTGRADVVAMFERRIAKLAEA